MPKVKTRRSPPPEGWDVIESTLNEFDARMRDAEAESHDGKRKTEAVWPIFRIHHQRSRYIWDMFTRKKAISRELYDYCLREGFADGNLIAKWKKPGYERLCCLRCIQTRDTNYGTTCICRVPRRQMEAGKIVECAHCGCRGCGSSDAHATVIDLRAGTVQPVDGSGGSVVPAASRVGVGKAGLPAAAAAGGAGAAHSHSHGTRGGHDDEEDEEEEEEEGGAGGLGPHGYHRVGPPGAAAGAGGSGSQAPRPAPVAMPSIVGVPAGMTLPAMPLPPHVLPMGYPPPPFGYLPLPSGYPGGGPPLPPGPYGYGFPPFPFPQYPGGLPGPPHPGLPLPAADAALPAAAPAAIAAGAPLATATATAVAAQ